MAGTITHLVIADMLLDYFKIQNPALFYCGNLAPDAIMARKNYVRWMKKHTHFKDDIPTDELHSKENFALYRKRLERFARAHLKEKDGDYELYLGYVVHMLADEVFILRVRDHHVQKLSLDRDNPGYMAYFKRFGRDVDLNDWQLVREYSFRHPMPQTLKKEMDYEIEGYITRQELMESKDYIIQKNFLVKHNKENTAVFPFAENEAFILEAVSFIKDFFQNTNWTSNI